MHLSSAKAAVSSDFGEQAAAAGTENHVPALHSSSCPPSPSSSQLEAHALCRQQGEAVREAIVPLPEAKEGAWDKEKEEWEVCSVLELSQGEDGRDQSLRTAEERVPMPAPHGAQAEHLACDLPSPHLPSWKPSVSRLQVTSLLLQGCAPGSAQAALVALHGGITKGLKLPAPGQSLEMVAGPQPKQCPRVMTRVGFAMDMLIKNVFQLCSPGPS